MRLLLSILLCFCTIATYSQETAASDSLKNEQSNTGIPGTEVTSMPTLPGLKQDTTINTSKTDSLQQTLHNREPNLTLKTDSIPIDSLKQLETKLQKLKNSSITLNPADSLKSGKIGSASDSLKSEAANINNKPQEVQKQLNSTQEALNDSLNSKFQGSLEGVTDSPEDSLKQITNHSQKKVSEFQDKQQEKLRKITDGRLPQGADGPVEGVAEKIPSADVNAPSPQVDKAKVPEFGKTNLPEADVTALDDPLAEKGEVAMPEMDKLSGDVLPEDMGKELKDLDVKSKLDKAGDVNLDGVTEDPLGKTEELSGKSLEGMADVEQLKEVKESVGGVKEISGEAGEYSNDLKAVKEGDYEGLEGRAEEHVSNLDEIKELKGQTAEAEALQKQYEQQIKELRDQQDMELFKEKLDEKLKEKSINHFSGNVDKLIAAQGSLLKYKQKYPNVKSIKDIRKETAAERMQKNFVERLVFGVDMQIVNRNDMGFLDVAPYAGFKITHRLDVYASYLWRYHVDFDHGVSINRRNIYGPRASVNYLVFKGFSAVGSYERIYRKQLPGMNENGKVWHNGVFLGISKKYKIVKGFYGSGQFLYNATYDNEGPYRKRLAVRFGFFLDLKSRKKQEKVEKSAQEEP